LSVRSCDDNQQDNLAGDVLALPRVRDHLESCPDEGTIVISSSMVLRNGINAPTPRRRVPSLWDGERAARAVDVDACLFRVRPLWVPLDLRHTDDETDV
jgi:hypothetical protein